MGSDLDDRLAHLRDRAEQDYPESWVPSTAGETIGGELVRYSRGTTSYGEQLIAVIRTPEGVERSVWLLHAVLRGEFAKLRPHPGELLLIRYLGKQRPEGGGNEYAAYRVEVDREEEPPDWDALGEETGSEPEVRAAMSELNRPLVDDDPPPF